VSIVEDYGPATKYLGPAQLPDSWVFVCDDDQEYQADLVCKMKNRIKELGIYQNHYANISKKTSGGFIHGYVGNLLHTSLLKKLPEFPLPDCARFVDDQWMSIYCFKENIKIFPTAVESYSDIFKVLDNNHEKLGTASLSGLNNRDKKIEELEQMFNVKFNGPLLE
jgi:hypothetical protein